MGVHAPSPTRDPQREQSHSIADRNPICEQCGCIGERENAFCQACCSLLPDSDPYPTFVSPGVAGEGWVRRNRSRVLASLALLLVGVALAGLAIFRATEPEPEEILAEESSHRALALLESLSEAQTITQAREISPSAMTALTPVIEMLPRLSSGNDTRPRLDAYRTLFRGLASLEHLHQASLPEWGKTRQSINSALRELAAHEPLIGLLSSQGRVAIDAMQDQIDEIERVRSVSPRERTVGRPREVRSVPHPI